VTFNHFQTLVNQHFGLIPRWGRQFMDDVTNPLIGKAKVLRDPGSNDAKLNLWTHAWHDDFNHHFRVKGLGTSKRASVVNHSLLVGGHYGMDRWVTIRIQLLGWKSARWWHPSHPWGGGLCGDLVQTKQWWVLQSTEALIIMAIFYTTVNNLVNLVQL